MDERDTSQMERLKEALPEPTPEQIKYVKEAFVKIYQGGHGEFVAQYCKWANFSIRTAENYNLIMSSTRTMYSLPVCWCLMKMTKCEDTERVYAAMLDGTVRALFRAKTKGRDEIIEDDARPVLDEIVGRLLGDA